MSKNRFKIFEKPPIEESYDYAEQVRRQIERCLEASAIQDKEIRKKTFESCILALENLIPFEDRDEQLEKDLEACLTMKTKWFYKRMGGIRIGTPENPVNDSPKLVDIRVVEWHRYFRVIFNKFVELKVTVRRGSYVG